MFVYPHCGYYELDDEQFSIKMQRVKGKQYSVEIHQSIVYKELFKYAMRYLRKNSILHATNRIIECAKSA